MINIIVAVAQNGVIGLNGRLPWDLKLDMARFKSITMGGVVIFGLNTFKDFGRPLVGRENIVLSSSVKNIDGALVFDDLDKAVEYAKTTGKEIFICGGESVYRNSLEFVDRMYITHILASYDGDRRFPDIPDTFRLKSSEDIFDSGVATKFCVYERIKSI